MDIKGRVKKSLILVLAVILINIALAIVKMYVGVSANSLTIMLDATNSALDIITSVVTAAAFCLLLAKRSSKAPYGYGRAEYLAGFIVAVVTVVMGGLFFMRSLNRMAMPEPVYFGLENCIIIAACVPIKLAVGILYLRFNKKLKSKALYAIMLDSFLDAGITTTSLVCFAIASKVNYAVDAIFGIALSIAVICFGIKAVVDSGRSAILGDSCDEEKDTITSLAERRALKVKSVRLHDYGYAMKVGEVEAYCDRSEALSLEEEILQALGGEIKVYPVPRPEDIAPENSDGKNAGDIAISDVDDIKTQ